MSQYIAINAYAPDKKSLAELTHALKAGAVIAYPTDSGYALGCKMGLKKPLQRIKRIRALDDRHDFTLLCRDLSEIAHYARVDNSDYRLLKRLTPGGYTFILPVTAKVPVLMQNKSKKTIGIRISEHPVPLVLSEMLCEPLLSTSLSLPGEESPVVYPEDLATFGLGNEIDYVIESDYCGYEPTTVVDMTSIPPEIVREGSGDVSLFK